MGSPFLLAFPVTNLAPSPTVSSKRILVPFGAVRLDLVGVSPLVHHVLSIRFRVSEKQVTRINTGGVVTRVQD
jgi:hypothetical protein